MVKIGKDCKMDIINVICKLVAFQEYVIKKRVILVIINSHIIEYSHLLAIYDNTYRQSLADMTSRQNDIRLKFIKRN